MLSYILDGKCFKLVCGAGNEDEKEVEKLTALYASAGCRFFDLSARREIIHAARRGLEFAGVKEAYLCVSVGIKGDPHVNKARIDYEKCAGCGKCDEICPQGAIKYHKVKQLRCIGCGRCQKVCSAGAISYEAESRDLSEILPPILEEGIDCIELHAMSGGDSEVFDKWNYISSVFDGMLSLCTSRGKLSDEAFVRRIKMLIKDRKPYTTIIQADGFPMSGSRDDFKTTLQTVAAAEIVQNENLPVYIMLSGGTNSKTAELAHLCGINYHGIAVGTYARKIVKRYVEREDFLTNKSVFNSALALAIGLVKSAG